MYTLLTLCLVLLTMMLAVNLIVNPKYAKVRRIARFSFLGPCALIMGAYGDTIDRTGTEALIPDEYTKEIIKEVPESSAVMKMGRRLPNMPRHKTNMPVLSALTTAYFVNGDTGLKQTTKMEWENKSIIAEEMAAIVPIPEAVLDDADYDIWGEIKPSIVEALGICFDQAVTYGTNAPSTWPTNILAAALAAGHVVTLGTNDDLYDDILGENGVLALIENDGYDVDGHVGALTMKSKLRGLRDADGNPIFKSSMQEKSNYMLDGNDIIFPKNGAIDKTKSLLVSGAWTKLLYSIRQDVTYKILDQAVIQDASGNIIYNLAQQDMVAMRVVMRLGWQLPNPINRINTDSATRYPFAFLKP
jgi:HK97 family phage major capsid protein